METFKIKQTEINDNNVKSAPDCMVGDPCQIKDTFDKLPELIANRFNKLVDNVYSKAQVEERINNKVVEISSADMVKAVYDKNADGVVDKADEAQNSLKLGGKPAQDYAIANDAVKKSGDVMTGALTLNGNPTQDMHAATKQYADSKTEINMLWENTSPDSSFAPQTINIDTRDYRFIMISWKAVAYKFSTMIYDMSYVKDREVFEVESLYYANAFQHCDRSFTISESSIKFGSGRGSHSNVTGNGVMVPLRIYGIK